MNKSRNIVLVSFVLFLISGIGQSANILFYSGLSSYSHRIAVWPLVNELTERGHKLTFLSPFPNKNPNPKVIEINPINLKEFMESDQVSILEHRRDGDIQFDWEILGFFGKSACEVLLSSLEIQEWVKTSKYDLVFLDALFNECGLGLAYVFKAKIILYSTTSVSMWTADMIGNVPETSWIPEMNYFYQQPMTFLERVHNTIIPLRWHLWIRQQNYFPELGEIIRKNLKVPDMPPLREIEMNTSLVFLNTHYSIEYARSLPPIYVHVGGLHITELKNTKLPKDMVKFIEGSGPDGVVYVSFGTYAQVSNLPEEIKSVFYEVFGSFKSTRFIWKFDIDRPADLPDNIMTVKWAPQQEILAHKKIKAFISHAGLLGIQEATYYGVPMIVFPIFAEQDFNANVINETGRGIKLEIIGIEKEKLHNALYNVLNDNRYKTHMIEASRLFKDRQMKPLETAVWWTEYILRHEDTSSLKPLSLYQTWYERRLLDVWFFIFFIIFSIFGIIFYIITKYLCSNQTKKENKFKTS